MNVNDIAKNTMARVGKAQEKLDALTAKRDELIAKYESELASVNSSIKEQEKLIASLNAKAQDEKLRAASKLLAKSGVTVDQLLVAVANNDLYGLQEMLENGGVIPSSPASDTDEESDEDGNTETAEPAPDDTADSTESDETAYSNYLGNGGY